MLHYPQTFLSEHLSDAQLIKQSIKNSLVLRLHCAVSHVNIIVVSCRSSPLYLFFPLWQIKPPL